MHRIGHAYIACTQRNVWLPKQGFSETKPCCYFSVVRRVMLYCGAGQQAPSDPHHSYTVPDPLARPWQSGMKIPGYSSWGAKGRGDWLNNPGLKSSGEGRRNVGSGERKCAGINSDI